MNKASFLKIALGTSFLLSVWSAPQALAQSTFNERTHLSTPYSNETADSREKMIKLMESEFQKEHIGLEMILAEGSDKSTTSRFGHIMLRLLDTDNDPYNDTVVSYYAQAPAGEGIGFLDFIGQGKDRFILPQVEVLNDTLLDYQTKDKRNLVRFIIPVFPQQIQKLKLALRATIMAPDLLGAYNLFQNNCFTALKKVFTEAKLTFFPALFMDHMFVVDYYMMQSLMTPYPVRDFMKIKGTEQILKPLFERLNKIRMVQVKKLLLERRKYGNPRTEPAPKGASEVTLMEMPEFKTEVEKLDDYSIGKLTMFWPEDREWKNGRKILIAEYKARGIDKDFKAFTELTEFDQALYRACMAEDKECLESRWNAALKHWTQEELLEYYNYGMQIYFNEQIRTPQLANSTPKKMFNEYLTSANAYNFYHFVPENLRKIKANEK